uniref:B30.2/SPRY domain-containing protein n=1 Tax=Neogobius melanostomus TaxID=47308 RepID=A0A8C6T8V7_9GOBI
ASEQFLCSICLEVFSEPVSTPCGHNFCNAASLRPGTLMRAASAPCHFQKAKTKAIKTILIVILICVVCSVFRQIPPMDRVRSLQQFAVDVTLDPDTVHYADGWTIGWWFRDSPQRFTKYAMVLGKQSFSSGRFYFEVQVKGKTDWALGVARESVNRKGEIKLSPKDGFWTIALRNRDEYIACGVRLSPQRPPQKVGVFVDYGAGLVSFYDVDSADLLYSFTNCSFREKLFPLFDPCHNDRGTNSAPLIISAVETK